MKTALCLIPCLLLCACASFSTRDCVEEKVLVTNNVPDAKVFLSVGSLRDSSECDYEIPSGSVDKPVLVMRPKGESVSVWAVVLPSKHQAYTKEYVIHAPPEETDGKRPPLPLVINSPN